MVEADEPERVLGPSRHDREDHDWEARRGVVWGLVVTGMGKIMPVESIAIPGNENLRHICSLADVHFLFPMILQ